MRKIVLVLMAVFTMSAALPVYAANSTMTKEEKDQCLLYSKECGTQVDDLQKRIRKLNEEIQKGERVYSPQELNKLNQKLKEASDILLRLETH